MAANPRIDPILADILGWAKGIALHQSAGQLDAVHVLLGAFRSEAGRALLARLLSGPQPPDERLDPELRARLSAVTAPVTGQRMELSPRLQQITDEQWRRHGELRAAQLLRAVITALRGEEAWVRALGDPSAAAGDATAESLDAVRSLLDDTEKLRRALHERILGQESAVERVCDAFFTTQLRQRGGSGEEIVAVGPRMILTFLGPPGVGKTYMAEILAHHFRSAEEPEMLRLDMSAYAGHQAHEQLVGFNPSYSGSNRGLLTGFAADHPEGFIIVDDIEKAHVNTQHIFLQVLDTGRVYDNNLRRDIDFRRMVVVFTTNLGRAIYDAPERAGILADSGQLADAVVAALREEPREPGTEATGLSAELLSRMAKGHVILFQRLSGLALERIADQTVQEVSGELEQSMGLTLEVPEADVLTLLVLRFGSAGDARRLTTGLRNYLYSSIKDLLREHRASLLEGERPLLPSVKSLRLEIDRGATVPDAITQELTRTANVLVIDDDEWDLAPTPGFRWTRITSREEADELLRRGQTDLVLLDLNIGAPADEGGMEAGLRLLRWLRSRYLRVPVYLFSESPERRGLSPEILARVSQEGGAHGVLQKRVHGTARQDGLERGSFLRQLAEVVAGLQRQRVVEHYRRRFAVIEFDMQLQPQLSEDGHLPLLIGAVREVRAVAAQDRAAAGWVDLPQDRLADVAGAEQAKQRLREVVAWLSDPRPVVDLGLELPKGILLTGPPGTGKTSLARAVAGESRVPFLAISGPAVFKKYVGESEATIRNLFAVAHRYAPAVIFIDEIDAVGARRSARDDHSGRVAVLNELLTQMDGFTQAARPIFVMAATNRPDILDPALVRAGRFDLEIEVPLPGLQARCEIFTIHLRGMQLADDVALQRLAARTVGMSGADIKQVCKEAGFIALRAGSARITHRHLDEAVTLVRFGVSSERVLLDEAGKWSTAVHEAGHALAQHLIFPDEPVTQISILPRRRSLGFTEHAPGKELTDQNLARVLGMVRVLLAGRAAEELLLGKEGITSGCADDLERATALVTRMIGAWGMDTEVGLLSLPGVRRGLGIPVGAPLDSTHSETAVAASRRWLTDEATAVRRLLNEAEPLLRRIAAAVMEHETLGEKELRQLFSEQSGKESDDGHNAQGDRRISPQL